MYKGQIFALLGHNGAGKTSTINMITGLYPATSGTVKVFGKDILTDLDEIRKSLGVCPQHDVLFDSLTVQEHLELYAVFKGVAPKECQQEIDHILDELELKDKRNTLSKDLSGGQKRKLSVGIAFVGGSKFILLDEPSSGLDTSARRKVWDMLKNQKHGKVILLTTHYMDEADYLGDRIAIMGEGKIQCLGSSLFLKNKFGVGYNLTVVKETINDPSDPIINLVKQVIPESKVTFNVSAEVKFQLPTHTAPKFKELFEKFDANIKEMKVSSYGVSVTTLEEVFLKVAETTAADNKIAVPSKANDETDTFDLEKERVQGAWANFSTQFSAITKKRYQYIRRDKKGLCVELLVPVFMIVIGVALNSSPIKTASPVPFVDNFFDEVNPLLYNTLIPGTGAAVDPAFISLFDSNYFRKVPIQTSALSAFDDAVFALRGQTPYPKASVFLQNLDKSTNTYKYQLLVDTRARDASAFGINKVNTAILRYATGSNSKTINSRNYPFPNTEGVKAISNLISGLGISFAFAIGMSFIPAGIVTFITKERETNVKHQQIISGMSLSAYWFSNLMVEYIKYLFPCILCPLITYGMGTDAVTKDDKFGALWMLFFMYGFSISTFTYLTSFLFKDHGAAQTATFFINFGFGFIGGLATAILRLITSTRDVAKIIQWIFRIIPTYSLTYGFLNLSNRDLYALTEGYITPKNSWEIDIAGGDILFLGMSSVIFLILLFVVEYLKNSRIGFLEPKVAWQPSETDGDVEDEAERIAASNEEFAIKVQQIRKVYRGKKPKVAVDRVSFGVLPGECFALLGVNGAGKTTTFKMLTGEIVPSSGDIYIRGYPVPKSLNQARKHIGYCPQFDALLENLTAREHLELYCALKGIPDKFREPLVRRQLIDLNLTKFEHVCAGTYSGGNKRKLSVAIALIGAPPIIFLDEPSNGMDPEARRFMWDVISKISTNRKRDASVQKSSSSVILTTHSMEEAEALSTKIAIQVDGNLKCLGSSQHIKNRYGGGYEIETKLEYPTKEEVKATIQLYGLKSNQTLKTFNEVKTLLEKAEVPELFNHIKERDHGGAIWTEIEKNGGCEVPLFIEWMLIEKVGLKMLEKIKAQFRDLTVTEHFQSFYRIKVASDITIGKVFGFFEDHKNELKIVQYSVRQTSIEQIFNAFANNVLPVKTKSNASSKGV